MLLKLFLLLLIVSILLIQIPIVTTEQPAVKAQWISWSKHCHDILYLGNQTRIKCPFCIGKPFMP